MQQTYPTKAVVQRLRASNTQSQQKTLNFCRGVICLRETSVNIEVRIELIFHWTEFNGFGLLKSRS